MYLSMNYSLFLLLDEGRTLCDDFRRLIEQYIDMEGLRHDVITALGDRHVDAAIRSFR